MQKNGAKKTKASGVAKAGGSPSQAQTMPTTGERVSVKFTNRWYSGIVRKVKKGTGAGFEVFFEVDGELVLVKPHNIWRRL